MDKLKKVKDWFITDISVWQGTYYLMMTVILIDIIGGLTIG